MAQVDVATCREGTIILLTECMGGNGEEGTVKIKESGATHFHISKLRIDLGFKWCVNSNQGKLKNLRYKLGTDSRGVQRFESLMLC